MRDCPRFDICRSISGGECFVEDASVHLVSAGQAEEVEDRGGDVDVAGWGVDDGCWLESWAAGDEGVVQLVSAHSAVGADADGPSPGCRLPGKAGVVGSGVPGEGHGEVGTSVGTLGPFDVGDACGERAGHWADAIRCQQRAAPRLLREPCCERADLLLGSRVRGNDGLRGNDVLRGERRGDDGVRVEERRSAVWCD